MLTIDVFMQHADPCSAGKMFLRRFTTVREAWLSDAADPSDMLWAVAHSPDVTHEQWISVCNTLIEADLTTRDTRRLMTMDIVKEHLYSGDGHQYFYERWTSGPSPWDDAEGDMQQCRDILRQQLPDAFKCTSEEFKTLWDKRIRSGT